MINIGQKIRLSFSQLCVKKVPFCAFSFKVCKENKTTKKIIFIFTKVEMEFPKMQNFMPISNLVLQISKIVQRKYNRRKTLQKLAKMVSSKFE
jgi:hypothetical protein